jgi:hypothetical protein
MDTSLPYGPLTDTTIHLCIDMQQMFAAPTPWHVPWMKRVMPTIPKIVDWGIRPGLPIPGGASGECSRWVKSELLALRKTSEDPLRRPWVN